jgi:hypothetical protein
LADHLRARAAAGTYWFHPANGGARTAIEGAILKACGVRAGTPDLILIKDGKTFGLLKARGAAVARAYFKEDHAALDDDGFFDTGDVATIDRWHLCGGRHTGPRPFHPARPSQGYQGRGSSRHVGGRNPGG